MTIALIALAVLCVALVITLVLVVRLLTQHNAEQLTQARFERSELLNRIQRPDLLPQPQAQFPDVLPEPEPDDMSRVGTIVYGDDDLDE